MSIKNQYPAVFSKVPKGSVALVKEFHSMASISESEVSQDVEALKAVYTPMGEERRGQVSEKDVQTFSNDSSLNVSLRFPSMPQPIVGRRILNPKFMVSPTPDPGKRIAALLPAKPPLSKPKLVRLKSSPSKKPLLRSVSAQRTSSDTLSSLSTLPKYDSDVLEQGPADLPPSFPISFRTFGSVGELVTHKLKREAVLDALDPLFHVKELAMSLAFQPVSQVYSAAFMGQTGLVSKCCRETIVFELWKTGEIRVICSTETCRARLLQVCRLPEVASVRLWVEESIECTRKLSSSLSLFIQRGAFRLKPIRGELDRFMSGQNTRPMTTLTSVSSSTRKLRLRSHIERPKTVQPVG